jgi:acyl-CoA thioesterase I
MQKGARIPSNLASVHNLLCIGDSLTEWSSCPAGWVTLVRGYINAIVPDNHVTVVNAGISGQTSSQVRQRFEKALIDNHPDLVILLVGDDIAHGIEFNEFRDNILEMVKQSKEHNSRLLLCTIPLLGESNEHQDRINQFNSVISSLSGSENISVVPVHENFIGLIKHYRATTGASDNFLTEDGIHFNAAGHQVLANTLLSSLGVSPELRRSVIGEYKIPWSSDTR